MPGADAVPPRAPRRRGPATGLAAFVLVALTGACTDGPSRTGDPAIDVRVLVSPTPASTADTRVTVEVSDGGAPRAGARVTVGAESAGDSLPVRALEDRGAGRYASAGGLVFPAPGRWVLVVGVALGGERRATFRWPIEVTGPALSPRPGAEG